MEYIEKLKQSWAGLAKRDQNALLVLVVALVFYIFYGVIYSGIVEKRDRYVSLNNSAEETLAWMNQTVMQIKTLGGGGNLASASNWSLSQQANTAARKSQLSLDRFQPQGDDAAQVWCDQVLFDRLLDFMSRLEYDFNLSIESLSITAGSGEGKVNARIRFSR